MKATFAFPDRTLGTAIIYVDGVELDRVPSDSLEYVIDDDSFVDSTITVAYTDGSTTTDEIPIVTFEQKVIQAVTDKVTVDNIPVEDILKLIDPCRREIIIDLCKYHYGEEIVWIKDSYYKLPNRWFFDYNGGGEISTFDIEFYSQTIPIYEFTTKDSVTVLAMNARDRWVQLDAKLPSTKILKVNYYATQRDLKQYDFIELLSLKIIYNYYQDAYSNMYSSTDTSANKIKVGDITVETTSGSSNSQNYYIDRLNKSRARYVDKIEKFKKGFYRTN